MAMTWYDAFGRPVDVAALRKEQASPVVRGMRRHQHAHHPAAGLTPDRLAQILRSSIDGDPETYLALAEDMEERDLHYAGVLGTRKRQVAGLEITVEAAGDDAKSLAAAETVREVVSRDGFEAELIDVLDAIGKGFSCTEIIWETSAKQWRPKRLAWCDPRMFTFDPRDGETPLLRGVAGQPEPLNPYGWIVHTAKAKSGTPIRGGLARVVAWAFMFKSYTMKDWAIFVEAYGQPLRLGKWGPGASEADKQKLLEAVASIGTDYAAIVPASMAVEFVEANISGSHELYERRADFLDRQVSKVVLGQTGTTDAIAGGHAVGRIHDKVRDDIEEADAKQLATTLSRDLARPVVDFEHGPQKNYPKILIRRRPSIDGVKFMATVEKFVRLGGEVGMSTVRDRIGIPDPAKGEKLLAAPKPPATSPNGTKVPDEFEQVRQLMAEGATFDQAVSLASAMSFVGRLGKALGNDQLVDLMRATEQQRRGDAIDGLIDHTLSDWQPLVAPIVAGLEEKLSRVTSRAEAEAVLRAHLATMDTSELQETLARAFFAARLAGEADQEL